MSKVWLCPACGRTAKTRAKLGDTSCQVWGVEAERSAITRNLNGNIVSVGVPADPRRSTVLMPDGSLAGARR